MPRSPASSNLGNGASGENPTNWKAFRKVRLVCLLLLLLLVIIIFFFFFLFLLPLDWSERERKKNNDKTHTHTHTSLHCDWLSLSHDKYRGSGQGNDPKDVEWMNTTHTS